MKKYFKSGLISLFILGVLGVYMLSRSDYETRLAIIQNPAVRHLMPTYRSLRKISDVFFIPYLVFTKNEYPQYQLTISPKNIQRLNEALPEDPFAKATRLTDENKVWVPATFTAGSYSDKVDVRYRGNQANHWGNYQKSYLIKFPKNNLFEGMRKMTLVIASDRRYFAMSLNNYRARKMGMIAQDEKLISLDFNSADHGVYLAYEQWSQEWIEKKPINSNSVLLNTADVSIDVKGLPSLHTDAGLMYWKSPNAAAESDYLGPLKTLATIVEHADDKTFAALIPKVIDIEDFYSRDIISILSGSLHNADPVAGANNLVMYFDGAEGRFKPIQYNSVIFGPEYNFGGRPTDLQLRIWKNPKFKEERDTAFYTYVQNNKEDDIEFLDNWMKENKKNFYADFAKDETNIFFYREIKLLEESMRSYFDDPFDALNRTDMYEYVGNITPVPIEDLEFEGSFKFLPDIVVSPNNFVKKYPQFRLVEGGIVLPSGEHYFNETVVVPAYTKFTIKAGAKLRMAPGASLISYSPVTAQGSEILSIEFSSQKPGTAWGVFAILNTENEESIIDYVKMSDGGDATINGVYISGMLAMHNADGTISNSQFENARADDGVNVKASVVTVSNNHFTNNSSDGIDVDFPEEGSQITGNTFIDNGGDSIDLSWADIPVTDNVVDGCVDKGISVGESSKPILSGNAISNCNIGIAIKDSSVVIIENSTIENNRIGISAYQKKPFFDGGSAEIVSTVLRGNGKDTFIGSLSTIVFIDE